MLVDSYSVIKRIESDHHNDVSTCCRILFEKWLEKTPDASWNELVTALNDIEMKAAADFITKQFKPGRCSCFVICNGSYVVAKMVHICTYLTNFVFCPTRFSLSYYVYIRT